MPLELEILNPLETADWDDVLVSNADYSFFHSSFWARTLLNSYHFIPRYFRLMNGRSLRVLIPVMEVSNALVRKKGVSLPFTDMSDPIIDAGVSWKDVYRVITDFGRTTGWKSLEIRGDRHVDDDAITSTNYFGHAVSLSADEDAVFRAFSNGTKGNIKKAEREGVEITIDSSRRSLEEFFELHGTTRKRHGLPPQPFSFFAAVHECVLSAGKGFVSVARLDGRPIAAAVFFHFGTKAIYKYSASDMSFQNVRANNLVLWESIRRLCRNGITSMSLGRTEPDNEGLRHYKLSWGAKEEILKYYKYDFSRKTYVTEDAGVPNFYTAIFRKMPRPLLNALGSVIYKYVA